MKTVFKNLCIDGTITDLVSRDGKIETIGKVSDPGIDFEGKRVYPGLIDIHTHGLGGFDTMDGALEQMARLQAKAGTTTFYPTTMTASHEALARVLSTQIPKCGAKIEGFHLEGPYLSPKHAGAQNGAYLRLPDSAEFAAFDSVKLITLAPELSGAMEYIQTCRSVVCLGHSDADYETGLHAAQAGAKCLTHTFNAMPPLHHRAPSLIGAAFDAGLFVQVICDGKHIHPAVIRMLYKLFGPERMLLISDSMRATGLPDGTYEFGGLPVTVKNKTACTQDGALAGSTSTLLECVKCAMRFGIPEGDAFRMASSTPARLMGLMRGAWKPEYDCDFLVLDEKNELCAVVIDGAVQ